MILNIKKPILDEDGFYQGINKAIQENRHVDYLKNVIEDYEAYKKAFVAVFTEENPDDFVYRFRITYLNKKAVWREILILGNQTFENLATTIITTMGWNNDHLHGFSLPQKHQSKNYPSSIPYTFFADGWEDDPHPTYKSYQIYICVINYTLCPKLEFEFDFGDSNIFTVEFKEMRKSIKGESKKILPKLIDQRGIAPEQYPKYD